MKNSIDFRKISLKELAAVISEELKENGIDSTLVGGACVSIYSHNRYQSYDLDFITYANMRHVYKVLESLHFKKTNKYFTHSDCKYYIGFVSPPIAIGDEPIEEFAYYQTPSGTIKMLTPTDCVKDRLASYFHWDDQQSLDQAIAICLEIPEQIDFSVIKKWAQNEGQLQKSEIFFLKINKSVC